MNVVEGGLRQYMLFVDLKSNIKDEECQEKSLRNDLEKLQREELNGCLDTVNWKIKRAELILACEKKRHEFFYNIIEAAEEAILNDDLFKQFKKYGLSLNEYRIQLDKEKTLLTKQVQELKQLDNFEFSTSKVVNRSQPPGLLKSV